MEKNKLQVATLLLCAVLLAAVLWQGWRIEKLEQTVERQYAALSNSVNTISGNVSQNVAYLLEDEAKMVESHSLNVVSFDKEKKSLSSDFSLSLKEWDADTKVCALLAVDGETTEYPMTSGAAGVFSARLEFPLNSNAEYVLNAVVKRNGVATREEVASGDFSELLPLHLTSWGGYDPYLKDDWIHFSEGEGFDVTFEQGNYVDLIKQAEFRVYCNDVLIDTIAPKLDEMNNGYAMALETDRKNEMAQDLSYTAALKDRFQLSFFCADSYGLCYEYILGNWTITTNGVEEYYPEVDWPILSWEK